MIEDGSKSEMIVEIPLIPNTTQKIRGRGWKIHSTKI
jgi:hypothetical protein